LLGPFVAAAYGLSCPGVVSAQELRVAVDTTYYKVLGRTRREWSESMTVAAREAGVKPPFRANARWSTRWWVGPLTVVPAGCVARAPVVELTVRYTMPHLVPSPETAPEDMREWRQHIAALWRHEEGHAVRGYRAAVEMRDSLMWVRAPTCAELRARLMPAVEAARLKYVALDSAYDVRSDHGARQGANLLSERERRSLGTPYRDTVP
jgi:predicted secreted Zn-dependent protease